MLIAKLLSLQSGRCSTGGSDVVLEWDEIFYRENQRFTYVKSPRIYSRMGVIALGIPYIVEEVRRRKWLEDNPETSSNDDPVVFDTSIIPWWSWVKRFHLPEAEKLNGRAAMVGFFMAYFVDSLTGVGLVDQMGNFFCKTLLLAAVVGVLAIRKNEDVDNLKKLWEETTFYDKQWQATWQDDSPSGSKKK